MFFVACRQKNNYNKSNYQKSMQLPQNNYSIWITNHLSIKSFVSTIVSFNSHLKIKFLNLPDKENYLCMNKKYSFHDHFSHLYGRKIQLSKKYSTKSEFHTVINNFWYYEYFYSIFTANFTMKNVKLFHFSLVHNNKNYQSII